MAVRFSTGLRNNMLSASGIRETFTNGVLKLYSGVQPTSADGAISGALLLEVTVDGLPFTPGSATNGLNFDVPVSAVLSKAAAETWKGAGIAAGTVGWGRLQANAVDDDTESTTLPRIDMAVAKTGADLNISNTGIVIGAPTTIDVLNIAMAES